jgi:hypothetical protein
MAVKILIVVFWVVTPCRPVGGYQCFGGLYIASIFKPDGHFIFNTVLFSNYMHTNTENGGGTFPQNIGDHLQDVITQNTTNEKIILHH